MGKDHKAALAANALLRAPGTEVHTGANYDNRYLFKFVLEDGSVAANFTTCKFNTKCAQSGNILKVFEKVDERDDPTVTEEIISYATAAGEIVEYTVVVYTVVPDGALYRRLKEAVKGKWLQNNAALQDFTTEGHQRAMAMLLEACSFLDLFPGKSAVGTYKAALGNRIYEAGQRLLSGKGRTMTDEAAQLYASRFSSLEDGMEQLRAKAVQLDLRVDNVEKQIAEQADRTKRIVEQAVRRLSDGLKDVNAKLEAETQARVSGEQQVKKWMHEHAASLLAISGKIMRLNESSAGDKAQLLSDTAALRESLDGVATASGERSEAATRELASVRATLDALTARVTDEERAREEGDDRLGQKVDELKTSNSELAMLLMSYKSSTEAALCEVASRTLKLEGYSEAFKQELAEKLEAQASTLKRALDNAVAGSEELAKKTAAELMEKLEGAVATLRSLIKTEEEERMKADADEQRAREEGNAVLAEGLDQLHKQARKVELELAQFSKQLSDGQTQLQSELETLNAELVATKQEIEAASKKQVELEEEMKAAKQELKGNSSALKAYREENSAKLEEEESKEEAYTAKLEALDRETSQLRAHIEQFDATLADVQEAAARDKEELKKEAEQCQELLKNQDARFSVEFVAATKQLQVKHDRELNDVKSQLLDKHKKLSASNEQQKELNNRRFERNEKTMADTSIKVTGALKLLKASKENVGGNSR